MPNAALCVQQLRDVVFQPFVGIVFFLRAFGLPRAAHNVLLTLVVQSLSTVLAFTPAGFGTEQGRVVAIFHGQVSSAGLVSFSVGEKIVPWS